MMPNDERIIEAVALLTAARAERERRARRDPDFAAEMERSRRLDTAVNLGAAN
jgi:hypothetical protein